MSADLDRWPHLKLATQDALDWHEAAYTAERLIEMADAMSRNPRAIPALEGGVWDTAVESVLRALAANDKALEKLNRHKPTIPATVVGLNRAVHVRVLYELLPDWKAAQVWEEVRTVWGVSAGQVKDDVGEYRVQDGARSNYRPDDAERLVQAIVVNTCNARTRAGDPRSSRDDVLEDFDKDMRHRAQQLRAAK
jgi:hypothetical protein